MYIQIKRYKRNALAFIRHIDELFTN